MTTPPIARGICRYCHCTDHEPCMLERYSKTLGAMVVVGCSWADDEEHTICSNPECMEKAEAEGLLGQARTA